MPEIVTRERDPAAFDALIGAEIDPRMARLYSARGIRGTAELNHELNALLPPTQLAHVDKAAVMLADAILAGKRLLI
ncbi:MAG: single-stranded-DNA-specific exonuclease RecJ, partial [Betaproteobacteria bacterium]